MNQQWDETRRRPLFDALMALPVEQLCDIRAALKVRHGETFDFMADDELKARGHVHPICDRLRQLLVVEQEQTDIKAALKTLRDAARTLL